MVFSGILCFGGIAEQHRILPFPSLTDMYLGYLLFIFLYTLSVDNRAAARRVKVHRLPNGLDEFEVLDDNRDSICTEPQKATEFCAKHGAVSVHNTRSCSDHEETLQCRCNSTRITFLLHEGKCVNNENVTRFLHGGNPGRRTMQLITQIFLLKSLLTCVNPKISFVLSYSWALSQFESETSILANENKT